MEKNSKNNEITPNMRKEMIALIASIAQNANDQALKRIYQFVIHTR